MKQEHAPRLELAGGQAVNPRPNNAKGAETMGIIDKLEKQENRDLKKTICLKKSDYELIKAAAKRKKTTPGGLIAALVAYAAEQERQEQAKEAKSKD